MSKKILLSGVKPTGRPHIGNYFGAMRQFVELKKEYESFVMIADLHALTTLQNRVELKENTIGILMDYMAIGLDPKEVTIFKQSDIQAHPELAWILECLTTVNNLMRSHAYKAALEGMTDATPTARFLEKKVEQLPEFSAGTFNYPMLMAADILLYDTDVVPVGKDQKQHIEYARDVAQKFNYKFGELFKMPEEIILENMATVPGTDGRKMSKSYGNTIPLFATDEEIEKAVMSIVTDSGSDIPQNVYAIHALLRDKGELDTLYAENKGQYKVLKEALIADLKAFIGPMRARREALEQDKEGVLEVLRRGGEVARVRAEKKMEEVRKLVGLKLY